MFLTNNSVCLNKDDPNQEIINQTSSTNEISDDPVVYNSDYNNLFLILMYCNYILNIF